MKYNKPPKSVPEQISLLQSRGMLIPDQQEAEHHLRHINYYRLSGYWLPFEADHATHQFKTGVGFNDVINLYVFDREMRLLLMDAIERLEVSVRTQWACHLSLNAGSHAFLEGNLASNSDKHQESINKLVAELKRSRETFIKHYNDRYTEPDVPPIWVSCEVMSLGQLSRWYQNLKPFKLRRAIAQSYHLDDKVLESVLHQLTYVRNLCAHHSRVWNRELTITLKLPRTKPEGLADNFNKSEKRKLYNTLVMLAYMLDIISPGHQWKIRLHELIDKYAIGSQSMGFPDDWQSYEIWQ